MIGRLRVYFKEMYPVLPRLFVGFLLFFVIDYLVILTNSAEAVRISFREIIGSLTIFSFLLFLRVADDFKDAKTDSLLFPERPLPSGRVLKRDLLMMITCVCVVITALNLALMPNQGFFIVLALYGALMSLWFFRKYQIQNSLILALITHNPVQLIVNLYVISFACAAYGIPLLTLNNLLIVFKLYFPGLIWEISRKIRAPEDETDYVTYSKLFGVKKPVLFILGVMAIEMIISSVLIFQLWRWAVILTVACYTWLVIICLRFMRDPKLFPLVRKVELFIYTAETIMVLFIVLKLAGIT